MEEEKKEELANSAEELKNETIETAKKVKDSIKGTDLKEETKVAKGFVLEMFKNPLGKLKEVASDKEGKYLKTAIILVVLWTIAVFVKSTYTTFSIWGFKRIFENMFSVLQKILSPACGIAVYSLIAFFMNKENKKPLTTILATITIAQLPRMIATVVSLLTVISSRISIITSPFASLCEILSVVLTFFGLKYMFETEKCENFFKKFVIVQLLYEAAYILIGLLGIYIF